jgi:hypothetical protein
MTQLLTVTFGTYNTDNVKSNTIYTSALLSTCDLLFIQEHWLYKFEKDEILHSIFP